MINFSTLFILIALSITYETFHFNFNKTYKKIYKSMEIKNL